MDRVYLHARTRKMHVRRVVQEEEHLLTLGRATQLAPSS